MTKHEPISSKDIKLEKEIWRKLGKSGKKKKREVDTTKQIRVVQSVKAGHIRGGHAYH